MIRFTDKIKLYFVLKESLAYSSLKNSKKKIFKNLVLIIKKKKKECTNYSTWQEEPLNLIYTSNALLFSSWRKNELLLVIWMGRSISQWLDPHLVSILANFDHVQRCLKLLQCLVIQTTVTLGYCTPLTAAGVIDTQQKDGHDTTWTQTDIKLT